MSSIDNIKSYFSKKPYTWIETIKQNRYIIAKLSIENNFYFLKIATDEFTTVLLKNQEIWSKRINEKIDNSTIHFSIPKVYESGLIDDDYYIISEAYENEIDFSKKVDDATINQIINCILFVKSQNIELLIDKHPEGNDFGMNTKKILELAKKYGTGLENHVEGLFSIIEKTIFRGSALAHREFKPEHLFFHNGKIGLIDGEWATNNIADHYDIVAFVCRVYVKSRNPPLAKRIMKLYVEKVKQNNDFDENTMGQIQGLMALRAIGQLNDIREEIDTHPLNIQLCEEVKNNLFLEAE